MENDNDNKPSRASRMEYAFLGVFLAVTGLVAGTASATTGSVTTMATDAAGDLTPIILGVGGALVAVAVVRFGVRWVLSSVGRGGRA